MNIQETLNKAIKGGYVPHSKMLNFPTGYWQNFTADPLFWQALGNEMGWYATWKRKWQRFVDHLASEGNAESFFRDLK